MSMVIRKKVLPVDQITIEEKLTCLADWLASDALVDAVTIAEIERLSVYHSITGNFLRSYSYSLVNTLVELPRNQRTDDELITMISNYLFARGAKSMVYILLPTY